MDERRNEAPSTRRVMLRWLAAAVWAGLIFFMSANTGTGLNEDLGLFSGIYRMLHDVQASLLGPDADVLSSVGHFCEYAVFGALLANALRSHLPISRACIVAVALASAYGVTDEIHQLFVPERMCDPLDWLVDTVGATVGAGVAYAAIGRGSRRDAKGRQP